MKVSSIDTLRIEEFPNLLLVEVKTDSGLIGLGETFYGPASAEAHIHEIIAPYLLGKNPLNIELHQKNLIGYTGFIGASAERRGSSAIDIALWDLWGQETSQPIYNLLGGKYHDKLRAYAYMPKFNSPEEAAEVAQQLVEDGNSACKFDPFTPIHPGPRDISLKEIKYAEKIFEKIRDSVGDDLEIGLGTHGQLTTYSAIRVSKILEPYNPFWFEEPVPPENIDEMARVASHTSIPIASGERLVTKYEFAQLIEKKAAQIIQIDVGQAGGILESTKVAAIADAHYAVIAPHMYCGPIAAAAAIQLDTCSPNFLIQEANQGSLHKKIFKESLVFEKGFIIPPTKPGLGVEFDEDVIKKYRV